MTNFVQKQLLIRKIDQYRAMNKTPEGEELFLKLLLTINSGQLDALTEGED
jgi:hypothetical protein